MDHLQHHRSLSSSPKEVSLPKSEILGGGGAGPRIAGGIGIWLIGCLGEVNFVLFTKDDGNTLSPFFLSLFWDDFKWCESEEGLTKFWEIELFTGVEFDEEILGEVTDEIVEVGFDVEDDTDVEDVVDVVVVVVPASLLDLVLDTVDLLPSMLEEMGRNSANLRTRSANPSVSLPYLASNRTSSPTFSINLLISSSSGSIEGKLDRERRTFWFNKGLLLSLLLLWWLGLGNSIILDLDGDGAVIKEENVSVGFEGE